MCFKLSGYSHIVTTYNILFVLTIWLLQYSFGQDACGMKICNSLMMSFQHEQML